MVAAEDGRRAWGVSNAGDALSSAPVDVAAAAWFV
jgi:hypothetical protein